MKSKGKAKAAGVFDAAIRMLECADPELVGKEELRKIHHALDVLEVAGKVEVVKWEKVMAAVANANYDALLRAIWEATHEDK